MLYQHLPQLNMSERSSTSWDSCTSGAMYPGVPQNVALPEGLRHLRWSMGLPWQGLAGHDKARLGLGKALLVSEFAFMSQRAGPRSRT